MNGIPNESYMISSGCRNLVQMISPHVRLAQSLTACQYYPVQSPPHIWGCNIVQSLVPGDWAFRISPAHLLKLFRDAFVNAIRIDSHNKTPAYVFPSRSGVLCPSRTYLAFRVKSILLLQVCTLWIVPRYCPMLQTLWRCSSFLFL